MSSSSLKQAATEFDLFSSLPTEIRLKVWRYYETRLSTLSFSKSRDNDDRRQFANVIHSCREARAEFTFMSATDKADNTHEATSKVMYTFYRPFLNHSGFCINYDNDAIAVKSLAGKLHESTCLCTVFANNHLPECQQLNTLTSQQIRNPRFDVTLNHLNRTNASKASEYRYVVSRLPSLQKSSSV